MIMTKLTPKALELAPLFNAAVAAFHSGNLDQAKALYSEVLLRAGATESHLRGVVHGQLGYLYWSLDDYDRAAQHYREAVALMPKSELASLGLFHTTLKAGRMLDALGEALRLLGKRNSDEYRAVFSDDFVNSLSGEERIRAEEARRLLDEYAERGQGS